MRAEIPFRRELLPPGSTVVCAVSGGADSVCLLDLVRRLPDVRPVCAHYNHGLRGEESRRDEAFVESLCRDWGVPFACGRGDAAARARLRGESLEAAARELRYAFLRRTAQEWGAQRIATAHTQNDNAETVLLNLARGTGLRGLGGIPPVRGEIVRPLLDATREEVEAYLAARGIPHVEDSTNAGDAYARNRARHWGIPAMESLHPGAAGNIARTARLLRQDEAFLEELARTFLAEAERDGALPVEALLAQPEPVGRRALRLWAGPGLEEVHVLGLLALCRSPAGRGAWDVPGGRIRKEGGVLVHGEPEALPPLPEREVKEGAVLPLPEAGLVLTARFLSAGEEIQSSFNIFSFAYVNICGKLTVASRRPGDRIRLRGRAGTRPVKKLLQEAGIPPARRETVPVLRDDKGPLAVYGFGQALRAWPGPGEKCIRIEIREDLGGRENE